ncbi:restriction endonuclease subunit S [Calorimonas adulescens]|uniref:Restriction endonuclease subunit S n=1 Tax=Calorimonas adulescens TaxID=2606906 RepID=A0A5D8QFN0_9THEO|nr:restriction endonuclease subunit S [Calorimonas adulescens]TZE82098.1 restriction endonuclease subunit S [Calorimonas adulescens]
MSRFKRYERYKDSGVEWIGEIPEHWEINKLKYICSESAVYGLNESAENYVEEGVRFIRTTDIDDKGNLDSNEEGVFLPEEKTKGYILKTGDLLVSRSGSLGTSLYFDENKYGKCSYAGYLIKFRANSKNHPKFLFYFSKSNIFYIQIQMALVSSTISNFNGNKYANMILTLPSYNEQKTIANFLDQKTTEIDGLIADKEKLIELLQEKRQAIITEAVTKGLNPNVRMKDSGIDWIGEIPEHWHVKKIKYLAFLKSGESITSEMIEEQGEYPVYGGNGLRGYTSSYTHDGNYVLIGRQGALCGNINYAQGKFWASEHAVVVTPLGDVDLIWLGELLRSMNLNQYSISAAQPGLSVSTVQNLFIPVPPYEEQRAISYFLKQNIADIEEIIQDTRKQIIKLKEYRQSLISEAVTGKIDVRDYNISN